ncbi:hypothetical protein [Patulibacter minatonensis]|uniref:hypothetical protein n=1 Tax=Patulibacter minatonensis TaxID=298163 RepID=UPI00047D628C|nr:hypothetical protein [Patulibacter minatonensis]
MTTNRKNATTAVLAAACVSLGAAAPFALADQPEGAPHGPKTTTTTPATTTTATTTTGTTPSTPAEPTAAEKKRGYGVLCKGQSKTHVAGQKGTPFSQCVVALAKVDRKPSTSPKVACRALGKKHVKGTKGTPFSRCVTAAAKQAEKSKQAR